LEQEVKVNNSETGVMVTIRSLINDIREMTEQGLRIQQTSPYSQPDLEFQVQAIIKLLNAGIKIEAGIAPVMIPEGYSQPIVMQARRLDKDELVTIPDGCDTMFIYNWFMMDDLMTKTKFQMIRLAFAGEGKQIL
jgi:hypothetical protein